MDKHYGQSVLLLKLIVFFCLKNKANFVPLLVLLDVYYENCKDYIIGIGHGIVCSKFLDD